MEKQTNKVSKIVSSSAMLDSRAISRALDIKRKEVIDKNFRQELEFIINKHSMENGSDTPDCILAEYLIGCLETFDKTTLRRDRWYGRDPKEDKEDEERETRKAIMEMNGIRSLDTLVIAIGKPVSERTKREKDIIRFVRSAPSFNFLFKNKEKK